MKSDIINSIYDSVDAMCPIIYIKHNDYHDVDEAIQGYDSGAVFYEYITAVGITKFAQPLSSDENGDEADDPECGVKDFLAQTYYSIKGRLSRKDDATNFVVIKGAHSSLMKPKIISWLTKFAEEHLNDDDFNATIFIVSPVVTIPLELESFITVFDQPLPDFSEIYDSLESFIDEVNDGNLVVSESLKNELTIALKGLTTSQIKQVLNLAYLDGGELTADDCKLILKEKQRSIKKSGLLELIHTEESINDIGGLEVLKDWLRAKARIYQNIDRAYAFGVDIPKGVMVMGLPGCGKSLAAKAISNLFELSLIRLDIGRLLGKYVGESEGNLRRALELAESISPCVLWIDEIEKAFSGLKSGGGGSEVTTRLFGQFLTWMQEKTSPVFIVATANDISSLPPEFLRRGRFDEIFFVDLPDDDDRRQILEVHLRKRLKRRQGGGANRVSTSNIELAPVVAGTRGFNGADLESLVKIAFENAYLRNHATITTGDLLDAIQSITSIDVTFHDQIELIRQKMKKMRIKQANAQTY